MKGCANSDNCYNISESLRMKHFQSDIVKTHSFKDFFHNMSDDSVTFQGYSQKGSLMKNSSSLIYLWNIFWRQLKCFYVSSRAPKNVIDIHAWLKKWAWKAFKNLEFAPWKDENSGARTNALDKGWRMKLFYKSSFGVFMDPVGSGVLTYLHSLLPSCMSRIHIPIWQAWMKNEPDRLSKGGTLSSFFIRQGQLEPFLSLAW